MPRPPGRRALANRLAAEGVYVYAVGRREADLTDTGAAIGSKAAAIKADITQLNAYRIMPAILLTPPASAI
jgi:NADP-dependent 3-hydroxy acid dehydrogenase YdfG